MTRRSIVAAESELLARMEDTKARLTLAEKELERLSHRLVVLAEIRDLLSSAPDSDDDESGD